MQCPQCGSARSEDENFCDSCGHKYATSDVSEIPEEPEHNLRGMIYLQGKDGQDAYKIEFDDNGPSAVERQDVSKFLTSQGLDPLMFSRKQCTLYKKDSDYYIEDGTTSIQDKPSANHTTVNGRDITGTGMVRLRSGDRIRLASLIDAIFREE